ncbi:MAG TPA: molybdenum cofactor biosynthesis protein MoaE [Aestuariivirgaceae bacterium]|jgi:molybdopterin synthase catalytic subunit|nr:molybdenum cofactor biosynthesis protein MoaE [Aestuariivirgaceae bacterium]
MIRLQQEPFDLGREYAALKRDHAGIGGIAVFVGTVREQSGDATISSMTLEHYPQMTERALSAIEAEARARWPLQATLIIHRYGRLAPGDDIVLVMTAAAHRQAALESCAFLIDWLKTKAPFWKLEESTSGSHWVAARDQDDVAAASWNKP